MGRDDESLVATPGLGLGMVGSRDGLAFSGVNASASSFATEPQRAVGPCPGLPLHAELQPLTLSLYSPSPGSSALAALLSSPL